MNIVFLNRLMVVAALPLVFAVNAHSTPKTYTFTGTVNQLVFGDMGLTAGNQITGQFIVDDQPGGYNGHATVYRLISVNVNVSFLGLGPWEWDGQVGSVSISNNLQGLDQFDFNSSLSPDGTVANQIGGVVIQTQDDEGTILNDESLPGASLPLSELEVARLELFFYDNAQFCKPDKFINECAVEAGLDEVLLSTYADRDEPGQAK